MNRHFPPPIITPRVPRERLDEAIQRAQASYPHLVPIYEAVRDFGCVHAIIPQRSGPFDQPKESVRRPIMLTIGDDIDTSMGPAAFDRRSIKRFVRSCTTAVIVSSEPIVQAYATVAMVAAIYRRNVILVETRLQHETAWLCVLRKMKPDLGVLLSTVKAEGRA